MPIPNPNGGALTEEHVQIRESVRDFADREVVPIANELDNKAAEIPSHVVKKMAELGYFGLIFSPDYGGAGSTRSPWPSWPRSCPRPGSPSAR